jgi:hypothetical protein
MMLLQMHIKILLYFIGYYVFMEFVFHFTDPVYGIYPILYFIIYFMGCLFVPRDC